jgi:putative tryptophan/tyrosine transport system substrate-binding protein
MASHIRRRKFLATLGGAAAAWPLVARAQQQAVSVIGFLGGTSAQVSAKDLEAFRKGLSETGYVESRNVAIEFRWTGGREDRMPELAADLVRRQVAVIATPASTAGPLAAKAATSTIPIVFGTGSDPVALGLVASLNRPGGNATGVMSLNVELTAKRLGLLRELAPQATRFVALVNPNAVMTEAIVKDVHASVPTLGVPVEVLYAGNSDRDIEGAFANLSQKPGAALLVTVDPFFFTRRALIVTRRHVTRYPPSISGANLPISGGWSVTGRALTSYTGSSGPIPAVSSKARNRPICRSRSRQNSTWSLISRPPRRSPSTFRPRCSPSPTR